MAEMLTAKEVQTLLQVDRSTIYRMAEAGQLPAIKVGKQWRFPGNLVESWLQSHTATSSEDELATLLPLPCVQLIQDTFAEILDVTLVVTTMAGLPVTHISNPYGLMKHIPAVQQKCMESWRDLATAIELEPKLITGQLGLRCARGLIRVGTELKGMVVIAGIAPDNWPPRPDQVRAIAAELGTTPEKVAAHLAEVFYLNEAEQAKALVFVQKIANIIAHIADERNRFMGKLEAIAQLIR
jgi:excisionase family DNA binding protein